MIEAICAAHADRPWPDGYGELSQGVRRLAAREGYLAALAVAAAASSSPQAAT